MTVAAPAAAAQERSPVVQQAIQQRDAGQLDAAVRLLRPYVVRTPDDVEAARVLAQALYWLKRPDEARSIYDEALLRHPRDAALNLEFGRMLLETGEAKRARRVAAPFADDPMWGARVRALLGTIAYWNGDFTSAKRQFRSALRTDSTLEEPRRQLGEIASVTAPWISGEGRGTADDQPLTRGDAQVAAGVHVTPLFALTAQAGVHRMTSSDSVALTLRRVEGGFSHYAPLLRLETSVVAGVLQHDGADAEWTGRARTGVRLPRHVTVRAELERARYLNTVASLHAPVMTQTATMLVALSSPDGWLGEVAVQRAAFPDDNAVRTFYGWLLVPVGSAPSARFRTGYGVSLQHADESRFVLADPSQPFPPGDPRFDASGVYSPYFTPANLVVHSLLADWEARAGRVTLRAGGSFGVWASDDEPELVAQPGDPEPQLGFKPRSPRAWTARAGLDIAATGDLSIVLSGDAMQAAFYRAFTARAGLTWRFAGAAVRRATR